MTIYVVAAIIKNNKDEILIARRKKGLSMEGLWEFPGGKVKNDESHTNAIIREICEEMSVTIEVEKFLESTYYDYGTFKVHLHGYICRLSDQRNREISSTDHDQVRWVRTSDLNNYIFAPADVPFIDKLCKGVSYKLEGGNMNKPTLKSNYIYKELNKSTPTIHHFLVHMKSKGLNWLPISAIDLNMKKHVLSYIDGEVPHDMPSWIWNEDILKEVALMMMHWHEASLNFYDNEPIWYMENNEVHEVICHNDFAPYNCVFDNAHLVGVIDFDVCSPGSRIWDLAYAAYRFIPLLPVGSVEEFSEVSPFDISEMKKRVNILLDSYNQHQTGAKIYLAELLAVVEKRLIALADWSEKYGKETQNEDIILHSHMYRVHAKWLKENKQYIV